MSDTHIRVSEEAREELLARKDVSGVPIIRQVDDLLEIKNGKKTKKKK